jgi:type IV secretory pathway VirJ component
VTVLALIETSTFKQRLEGWMDANCVAIQVPRLSVDLSVGRALMIYGLAEDETK